MRYALAVGLLGIGLVLGSGVAGAEMDDYSAGYDSYRTYNTYDTPYGGFSGPSGTFQSPDSFSQQQTYQATSQFTTAAGGEVTARQQLFNAVSTAASNVANVAVSSSPQVGAATFSGAVTDAAHEAGADRHALIPDHSVDGSAPRPPDTLHSNFHELWHEGEQYTARQNPLYGEIQRARGSGVPLTPEQQNYQSRREVHHIEYHTHDAGSIQSGQRQYQLWTIGDTSPYDPNRPK
ncbi:MAG: hypothetical protein HY599_06920 [Candidatus Omnitrophica bacterium]|nr:hypothetical protein [Candidatus Omnitrophota bacterium]